MSLGRLEAALQIRQLTQLPLVPIWVQQLSQLQLLLQMGAHCPLVPLSAVEESQEQLSKVELSWAATVHASAELLLLRLLSLVAQSLVGALWHI